MEIGPARRHPIPCVVGILFGCAGRLDWPRGWFFIALATITLPVTVPVFRRENPRILRTRLQKTHGTKPFDKVIYIILMSSVLACLAVAGLDARFGWSSLAFEWTYLGLLLYMAGYIPIGLAMSTNPFLERTVRIQSERGHVAVTTGPYRVVRHPMYAGILIMTAGWPLLLGSIWSYVPLGRNSSNVNCAHGSGGPHACAANYPVTKIYRAHPVPPASRNLVGCLPARVLVRCKSHHQHLMVRALQVNALVKLPNQLWPVLGEQWNDGIEPLLQVFVRIDQPVDIRGVARGPFVARQHLAPDLPLDFRKLIRNLVVALAAPRCRASDRTVPVLPRAAARSARRRSRVSSSTPVSPSRHQSRRHPLAQSSLAVKEVGQTQPVTIQQLAAAPVEHRKTAPVHRPPACGPSSARYSTAGLRQVRQFRRSANVRHRRQNGILHHGPQQRVGRNVRRRAPSALPVKSGRLAKDNSRCACAARCGARSPAGRRTKSRPPRGPARDSRPRSARGCARSPAASTPAPARARSRIIGAASSRTAGAIGSICKMSNAPSRSRSNAPNACAQRAPGQVSHGHAVGHFGAEGKFPREPRADRRSERT